VGPTNGSTIRAIAAALPMVTGRQQTDSVGRHGETRWLTASRTHASKSDEKVAISPAAVIVPAKPVIALVVGEAIGRRVLMSVIALVVGVEIVRVGPVSVIAGAVEVAIEQARATVRELVAAIALATARFNVARVAAIRAHSEVGAPGHSTGATHAPAAAGAPPVSEVHGAVHQEAVHGEAEVLAAVVAVREEAVVAVREEAVVAAGSLR